MIPRAWQVFLMGVCLLGTGCLSDPKVNSKELVLGKIGKFEDGRGQLECALGASTGGWHIRVGESFENKSLAKEVVKVQIQAYAQDIVVQLQGTQATIELQPGQMVTLYEGLYRDFWALGRDYQGQFVVNELVEGSGRGVHFLLSLSFVDGQLQLEKPMEVSAWKLHCTSW